MKTAKRKAKPQPETKQPDFELYNSDPKLLEKIKAYTGWYIIGVPKGHRNWPWYEAFDAAERRGNKEPNKPLVKMLRDPKWEVTPAVRGCLADLLERHTLVRKRGGRQVPIYAISQADAVFLLMKDKVLELTKNGTPVKEAIERVASLWHADADEYARADAEDKLDNAVKGKRGGLSRTEKRLRRLAEKEWADLAQKRGWRNATDAIKELRRLVGMADRG
jgi:hypothetical protein